MNLCENNEFVLKLFSSKEALNHFLQVFREIMKVEFFFIIIIMTLEEFYNIFSKIYLFLRGMFSFVFWIVNFGVPQIFHIIKSGPWLRKD